ncbi:MAG: DNA-binding response regulator [Caulobacteraceae bacterium]|nr:DNA-binding response regulator [Caulobacteraceae bacterium]
MKVLVVEDDERTASFIARGLVETGHTVDVAKTGDEGVQIGMAGAHDVIVMDRMLPGRSGLEAIGLLRAEGINAPVLVLTALGSIEDRVSGLEGGADDYLVKPFAFSELLARLNALVRRPPLTSQNDVIRIADLSIDTRRRKVTRADKRIELTPQEYKLLEFLARRVGETVTRTMLLESLWGFHFDPRTNIVDAHVSRLRSKVDRGFDIELIRTLRGVGYVLDEPE